MFRLTSRLLPLLIIAALTALLVACGGSGPAAETPALAPAAPAISTAPTTAPVLPGQINLAAPLPEDPDLLKGRLDNGLTWYVRHNEKPAQRASLFLVVGAGSVDEDDDQKGLAHMAEHMAFNGTEEFPRQELVNYLESVGMAFGPEVNAFTSLDQTVYMLQVPTDDLELLDTGLRILENWAHRVSFEDEEIDKERGVIVEEWRGGLGANDRIYNAEMPVVFYGSKYADRHTIGDMDVVKNHEHDVIRRYYRDWYRPDLQAVIAVGDFDTPAMVSRIEELFGAIPARQDPRPRIDPEVPLDHPTLAAVTTDPEATRTTVDVMWKHAPEPKGTVGDSRRGMVMSLATGILRARLGELAQQADPPFAMAFGGDRQQVRTLSAFSVTAFTEDSKVTQAVSVLGRELARVVQHGFTQSELDRQRIRVMRRLERQVQEKDKTESRRTSFRYMREFLYGGSSTGPEQGLQIGKQLLPGITLEEVSAAIPARLSDTGRVITVSGPEKEGLAWPTEDELVSAFSEALSAPVEAYEDESVDEPLVPATPAPVDIVERSTDAELGTTSWTLANGVRVVIKPTDFKNDEVLMSSYAWGGNSRIEDLEQLKRLGYTAFHMARSGVGEFDATALQKKLAGKVVSCGPEISGSTEGLGGNASPRDLETLCQLAYLRATAPRRDPAAFAAAQSMLRTWLGNRDADPMNALRDTVMMRGANGNPRVWPMSTEGIDAMDLDAGYDYYRHVFADCDDFTFFFVGNVTPEALEPLARTWLGNLPTSDRVDEATVRDWPYVDHVSEAVVHAGVEPKSNVQFVFNGKDPWSPEAEYALECMVDCLRIRLRQVIREEKSGTYGVRLAGFYTGVPTSRWRLNLNWGCEPERVDELTAAVWDVIESMKTEGPDAETLAKVRETQLREDQTSIQENRHWMRNLVQHHQQGTDPRGILQRAAEVETMSAEMVREAARRHLSTERHVKATLYPARP